MKSYFWSNRTTIWANIFLTLDNTVSVIHRVSCLYDIKWRTFEMITTFYYTYKKFDGYLVKVKAIWTFFVKSNNNFSSTTLWYFLDAWSAGLCGIFLTLNQYDSGVFSWRLISTTLGYFLDAWSVRLWGIFLTLDQYDSVVFSWRLISTTLWYFLDAWSYWGFLSVWLIDQGDQTYESKFVGIKPVIY